MMKWLLKLPLLAFMTFSGNAVAAELDIEILAAGDGIAAEASENVETLTISDINLADLSWARAEGTVRNLADRRFDLYRIEWDEDGKHPGKPRPRREPLGPKHPGGG